jgi:hypothetical protein
MSRLLLPDSAKPEAPQATLSLSWGTDGANVVLVVVSGAVTTQVLMPPALAIQLGEGVVRSAKEVLEVLRKAATPSPVNGS